ncbi:MAG TPA: hypothetical protein VGG99_26425 [Acetobacteraceae bacterium]|jgi:hypothetical protein
MAEILCAEDFAPFVGKTFQAEGHPHLLTLVTLHTRTAGGAGTGRASFSLILRGPRGAIVPEGFYRFLADGRQDFELYMIPVQTALPEHQDYQIVFN